MYLYIFFILIALVTVFIGNPIPRILAAKDRFVGAINHRAFPPVELVDNYYR